MKSFRIVLVGNYSKDHQESMNRFVSVIANGLNEYKIEYQIWTPILIFGYFFKNTNKGIGKWAAYVDKYFFTSMYFSVKVLSHKILKFNLVYHICDHSNSVYVPLFPIEKTVITCHDVLAIRGALGYKDAYCNATKFGVVLQKQILENLSKNISLVFVSNNTQKQFLEIINKAIQSKNKVIYNGLNANFSKLSPNEIESLKLKYSNLPKHKFLLHVGSNLERKNRSLIVKMLFEIQNNFEGVICFAGQKPDSTLNSLIKQLNLSSKIVCIEKPNHELLNLLYNICEAFIFPSFSEGFGWPIIEAQICGAPVICSSYEPMPEIGGKGVLIANPNKVDEFVNQFLLLKNNEFKQELIQNGFENVKQFQTNIMLNNYIQLYQSIA